MAISDIEVTRRHTLKAISAVMAMLTPLGAMAIEKRQVIKKSIPASSELLPVIGLGTSRTFDVDLDPALKQALKKLLEAFFQSGGALIDSSPMYGNAEQVTGELLKSLGNPSSVFAATKVWINGREDGVEQMTRSFQRMNVEVMDLMQIHNLRDWSVHLKTLRDWKERGKIRYIGVTTSHGRDHQALESLLKKESFDFVQLSYNLIDREAEKRLLPIAQDKGIAVLANRPFQRGDLFRLAKGRELPVWAAELGCSSWGQLFLKYVVSHPAVTCTIPATNKLHHLVDNMGAGLGVLPNNQQRKQIQALYA